MKETNYSMPMRKSNSLAKLKAFVIKDLKVEMRTRYAVNALIMFACVTLFALGVTFSGIRLDATLHAALLWILIYFAGLQGLSGGFIKEEESGTAMALRVYASPQIIFFGKYIHSLIILTILVVFLLPLYYILMNLSVERPVYLLLVIVLGLWGFTASSTITAAIVSKANVKGALFAVLSFPLMLPLLLVAISATTICVGGGDNMKLLDSIKILIAYPVIVTAISYLLFDYIWSN